MIQSISYAPQRIVSLVPSQTELLIDLGLESQLIGITKFCIHPSRLLQTKTIVGGTKNLHMEVIDQLQPDLILGNREENVKESIEKLAESYPVWISDLENLNDALTMIHTIGKLTDRGPKAIDLADSIKARFEELKPIQKIRIAYLIWQNPFMVAGSQTFIHDMLHYCGLINVFNQLNRYPEITEEQLREANPEYILLSSEPFPFRAKHQSYFQQHFPDSRVLLVDGEMFSWYGSRLLQAVTYFQNLIKTM